MSQIAVYSGNIVIYWNSIIITLGIIAGFTLSLSLYSSSGGRAAAMWAMLPMAILFSVFFSRILHWYCHMEQYAGFLSALTDFSTGSYLLPGALLGVVLSVLIVKLIGFSKSCARQLDAVAPGLAICVAFIRLSALFDSTCRSKIIINNPALQHLPLASILTSASGTSEYRFATFFVEFLIMLVLSGLLVRFFLRRRNLPIKDGSSRRGHVFRMFLLWFFAVELVTDSTRYDTSFFHFTFLKGLNPYVGFVSLIQIIAAIVIISLLVYYSRHSIRSNSFHWYHGLSWLLFLLGVAGVGVSEYMVQRHGDWYLPCYAIMSLCSLLLALLVHRLYLSCCAHRPGEN